MKHFHLQFHFDQSKVRSEIRLREGRTKPIDILYKQLNGSDDFDIEINEPYMVFKVNIPFCSEVPVFLCVGLLAGREFFFLFSFLHLLLLLITSSKSQITIFILSISTIEIGI